LFIMSTRAFREVSLPVPTLNIPETFLSMAKRKAAPHRRRAQSPSSGFRLHKSREDLGYDMVFLENKLIGDATNLALIHVPPSSSEPQATYCSAYSPRTPSPSH
jgi:hypothetical protein